MLYILVVMPINFDNFSSDFVSLLFSFLEFLYSTITFMNGEDNIMVNVLAVVGSYMVGTKAWKDIAVYQA